MKNPKSELQAQHPKLDFILFVISLWLIYLLPKTVIDSNYRICWKTIMKCPFCQRSHNFFLIVYDYPCACCSKSLPTMNTVLYLHNMLLLVSIFYFVAVSLFCVCEIYNNIFETNVFCMYEIIKWSWPHTKIYYTST